MKNARMGHYTKELINARPGNCPRNASSGQALYQLKGGAVSRAGVDFRVYQDVRIDGLHGSASVHKIKQGVTVQEIDSRKFGGFPTLKTQFVRRPDLCSQRAAEQVIGHGFERSPLFGGFLLECREKLIVNRQGGASQTQKRGVSASRCLGRPRLGSGSHKVFAVSSQS